MDKESKKNLMVIISIILAGVVIFLAINYSGKISKGINYKEEIVDENFNNVSIVEGKQIIVIKAKGGYKPEHSVAKAGIDTVLRLDTNGTFDCSSSVRIPSMDISQNLPMSGTTDIDIGIQEVGMFYGTCGMGMYPFDVRFE